MEVTTLLESKTPAIILNKELNLQKCGSQRTMSFCIKCGKELPVQAQYCPACGAPVQSSGRRKSKSKAVYLAISLSWLTSLYTYKKDAWKFWAGTAIGVFSVVVILIYIFNIYMDTLNILGMGILRLTQ